MFGYIYKITIQNPMSNLFQHFYIGQKASSVIVEKYYGSGSALRGYCRKYLNKKKCNKLNKKEANLLGLKREILSIASTKEELDKLEHEWVNKYKNDSRCLNRMVGGSGYNKDYLYNITEKQRKINYNLAKTSNSEIFVDLPGTIYQISSFGRIRNKKTGKIKRHYVKNRIGYLRTELFFSPGKKKRYLIHRLVASAFIENPDLSSKIQVNHIDGNRANNRFDNLEWVSASENMLHAYYISKRKIGFGNGFGGSKKVWNKGKKMNPETSIKLWATRILNTPERKTEIYTKYLNGVSVYNLSKEYNLRKNTIRHIIKRQSQLINPTVKGVENDRK